VTRHLTIFKKEFHIPYSIKSAGFTSETGEDSCQCQLLKNVTPWTQTSVYYR